MDATGQEAGRGSIFINIATANACYEICDADGALKGCTYHARGKKCIPYYGNVVKGSGNIGYTCYITGL